MTDLEAIKTIEDSDCYDHEAWIAAFQQLIDSGTVWHLQGFYGRNAARLISLGECHPARTNTEGCYS